MFSEFDADSSGRLEHAEVAAFVDKHPELWAMLAVNTGKSDDEARAIAVRVCVQLARGHAASAPMELKRMFDIIDTNNSGTLDRAEVRELMAQVFPLMGDAEFDAAFKAMDGDGNGDVDFDEFKRWWLTELQAQGESTLDANSASSPDATAASAEGKLGPVPSIDAPEPTIGSAQARCCTSKRPRALSTGPELSRQKSIQRATAWARSREDIEMTQEQFSCFLTQYLASPAGQQEFFARTVFTAFDQDGNGELDELELDQFLNLFYEAGSIFFRDKRLPEKSRLRQLVMECDADGDGRLSFEEIADVITGKMALSAAEIQPEPQRQAQAEPEPEPEPELEPEPEPEPEQAD